MHQFMQGDIQGIGAFPAGAKEPPMRPHLKRPPSQDDPPRRGLVFYTWVYKYASRARTRISFEFVRTK